MHKGATLIVVGVDTETPDERENSRLREYAQSSGPAGVGMEKKRPEDKSDETIVDMLKRYGSEVMDIHGETMESLFGDVPSHRIRETADPLSGRKSVSSSGGSFTVMVPSGGEKIDPSLLEEVKSIDDVYGRDPDMVLADWMGDEDEVDSRFLASDSEEPVSDVGSASMGRMSEDISDYNRFGGDTIAMELDRRESTQEGREYSDEDNDSMLRALMESNVEYADIRDAEEGFAAIREDLGRNVEISLLSKDGTRTIYSAYRPDIGRLKYSYDSATGVGRILGGQ